MGIIDGNNARIPLGLLAVLGVGVLVGALNSFLVIWLKITPMIATLAVGYIVSSVVSIYNRSFNTMKVCSILGNVVKKRLFNIPLIVYLVLLLGLGIYLVFRYMTYGKALLALGQNKMATLSGWYTGEPGGDDRLCNQRYAGGFGRLFSCLPG